MRFVWLLLGCVCCCGCGGVNSAKDAKVPDDKIPALSTSAGGGMGASTGKGFNANPK